MARFPISGSQISTPVVGAFLDPVMRGLHHSVNDRFPTVLPDPGTIIQAYHAGLLDETRARDAARAMGADWSRNPAGARDADYNAIWRAIDHLLRSVPSESVALEMFLRGQLDRAGAEEAVKRAGGDGPAWFAALEHFRGVPGAEHALSAFVRGMFTADETREAITRSGHDVERWLRLARLYEAMPPVGDLAQGRLRGVLGEAKWKAALLRLGLGNPDWLTLYNELINYIPPPQDLIRFGVRETFDEAVIARLGYNEEYPTDLQQWFDKQGMGYSILPSGLVGATVLPPTWGHAYWWAHWQPLAPTQTYVMMHRLRPSRVARYHDLAPGLQPFTIEDVRTWLKVADYPPGVRDLLAAISFTPLRLSDIQGALTFRIRDRAWAIEELMDRGMNAATAGDSADIMLQRAAWTRDAPLRLMRRRAVQRVVDETLSAYRVGIIGMVDARVRMVDTGLEPDSAGALLASEDARVKRQIAERSIRQIRQAFLQGIVDLDGARAELLGSGIQAARVEDYLSEWRLRAGLPRRMASSAQIARWVEADQIREDDATARLRRLGWSEPDTFIQLALVRQRQREREAREAGAAARAERSRAAEIARILRAAESERRRLQTELRRLTPLARIQRWLTARVVTLDWARDRLTLMGYGEEETELYIREWRRILREEAPNGETTEPLPPTEAGASGPAAG